MARSGTTSRFGTWKEGPVCGCNVCLCVDCIKRISCYCCCYNATMLHVSLCLDIFSWLNTKLPEHQSWALEVFLMLILI